MTGATNALLQVSNNSDFRLVLVNEVNTLLGKRLLGVRVQSLVPTGEWLGEISSGAS